MILPSALNVNVVVLVVRVGSWTAYGRYPADELWLVDSFRARPVDRGLICPMRRPEKVSPVGRALHLAVGSRSETAGHRLTRSPYVLRRSIDPFDALVEPSGAFNHWEQQCALAVFPKLRSISLQLAGLRGCI